MSVEHTIGPFDPGLVGGVVGTTADWVIDGTYNVTVALGATTEYDETLTYFAVTPITYGSAGASIADVSVRVVFQQLGMNPTTQTYSAQLYSGGAAIGTAQASTWVSASTAFDATFSGSSSDWGAALTDTIVKSSGFGATVAWNLENTNAAVLTIDGVSVEVTYTSPYQIEERIYTNLTNHTGLTTLTTQIYPYDPPQGAKWPLVLYSKVSGEREHAMGADPNVTHSMFEFRVEADDPLECKNVSVQVMDALDRWASSTEDVEVQETLREYEFAGVDYVGADDRKVYFNEIGFMIHHGE